MTAVELHNSPSTSPRRISVALHAGQENRSGVHVTDAASMLLIAGSAVSS